VAEDTERSGRYQALRLRLYQMDREMQRREMRQLAATADSEYCYPLEDERARRAYGVPSGVNNVLIINRVLMPQRVTAILVKEILGF
jgi:hypothetical protein